MRLFLLLRFAKAHTYCTLPKPTEPPPPPLREEENEKSICEKREEEDFPFRLPLFLPNLTNHVCRSGGGRAAAARLSPSLFPPSSSSSVFPSVRSSVPLLIPPSLSDLLLLLLLRPTSPTLFPSSVSFLFFFPASASFPPSFSSWRERQANRLCNAFWWRGRERRKERKRSRKGGGRL